ncbi:MAG: PH domain-containing protein [Phycisphaeraceae bacterium]|nr:PH domain-containing protein [Phycisphaeraceae bacterium]MCW5763435.1 PH domain-containing protein [Phycisphaeraceae bacterium]
MWIRLYCRVQAPGCDAIAVSGHMLALPACTDIQIRRLRGVDLVSVEEPRWYPSKIDWWLVPILCVPPGAAVAVCVTTVLAGSITSLLVGVAVVALVAGLYVGLVFPMRYGLDETHLIVRHGLCRQRIALAKIVEVRPTRNPLSSPALSLDRLHVRFGQGVFKAVMISPAERDCFLSDLAEQAGLNRVGNGLSRT